MSDDHRIEREIQARGLTAPRITPDRIDSLIVDEAYHVFPGTTVTICLLTLENGFAVSGESACASPENFDAELGRDIARRNAREKVWALEGYLLREQLHRGWYDAQVQVDSPAPVEGKPGFLAYQGKPTTRHAYRVKPGDVIEKVGEAAYRILIEGEVVEFKAYEEVKPGDYIVHLTDDDVYHCRADVFHERNVVRH